ncbi:MAG: phenylalanine--tRNA ligase subunit beta [Candidatus Altiarchaeales archaeon]|nr:MAG: phenylalanine--tRNA ligase subunit beta [Candidatus Altiarchaeales archaeon]RLI93885.1 MAG: phenylalanine--tRNA ligase subunit beta [Candidatus Altiarchaeales archaeon]HDO82075.1 phenylalanine--tRNA ligase subunit beta [Candidatus Altiarchaeales archaeon]HEX54724.1 phenylalanine--tRNA ligase subunit beta [Candidatus Altiarchaeales archaeon]
MPTVEFSFDEFIELIGMKLEPGELQENISMLGVDLETIDSERIVMEIFPNRPDLLSVEGFARAMRGLLGIKKGIVERRVINSDIKLFIDPTVNEVRPFISAAVIRNVSLDESTLKSLMNLQEKLHITHGRNRKRVAIGVHDLENIDAPFTYKAVKPDEIEFVPLDMDKKMNLMEILEKHPKGIQYKWILKDYEMYPIILDRNNEVLSFPPIINAELTRVTERTRDLFIEVTGTSEIAVNQALNIIVTSITERNGEIYSVNLMNLS